MPSTLTAFVSFASDQGTTVRADILPRIEALDIDGLSIRALAAATLDKQQTDLRALWQDLRLSDIVVALVEQAFLDRITTLQELIRADELGIPVFAIVRSAIADKFQASFPFVHGEHIVHWTDGVAMSAPADSLVARIRNFLRDSATVEALRARRAVRSAFSIHDHAISIESLREAPRYVRSMLSAVVDGVERELKQILREDYDLDLSAERDFLARASGIFSNAQKVFAVSRDDVSGFWEREENVTPALEYVTQQPQNAVRLFVFSEPRKLNRYREILDVNDSRYGADGAVLVCSMETFQNTLRDHFSAETRGELANKDFGLLQVVPGDSTWLLATLGRQTLRFNRVPALRNRESQRLISWFQAVKSTTEAWRRRERSFADAMTSGFSGQILRWKNGLGDEMGWDRVMHKVFAGHIARDLKHIVLLSLEPGPHELGLPLSEEDFVDRLRRVRDNIEKALRDILVSPPEVWVGRREEASNAQDGRYKGTLITNLDRSRWKYTLVMDFADKEHLSSWYSHEKHSEIRQQVYEMLNTEVKYLYSELQRLKSNEMRAASWAVIEAKISRVLWRLDFSVIEDYEAIARMPAFAFGDRKLKDTAEAQVERIA